MIFRRPHVGAGAAGRLRDSKRSQRRAQWGRRIRYREL